MLEINLVGGVEALVDGRRVNLPGRRTRALLALLALNPGKMVSVDNLATGIWDDDLPERVRGSLQTYVGRLRRLLGDDVIDTGSTGYALMVPRSAVDLLSLWDAAQAAVRTGSPDEERGVLADTLRRWHGEPFGDAPSSWLERHERPAWVEQRLLLFERWVDLSYEAAEYRSYLEELTRLAERNPLQEPLWVRLLKTLDRMGRTAEALDRYEAIRKGLAEELGVDPSSELRGVYQLLLERTDEHAQPTGAKLARSAPHQLPARVRAFVGRGDQLDAMNALVRRSAEETDGAVLALHGPAGAGKTTLAVHWAYAVKDEFPDGELFLDLQGYGPGDQMDTGRALAALLRGLGVPSDRVPDDDDGRSAMLRSETDGRRMLIVLDNARESEQVRPLLPGPGSLVLVTSRTQLRALAARDAAHRVRVDPMPPDESIALLERRIAEPVADAELTTLAELCGHLPVALSIAAERIGRDVVGQRGAEVLVRELQDRRSRLDALTSSEDDPLTSVRAVLEWSYRSLDDASAEVLRQISLYSAPLISVGAVAALLGARPDTVLPALDRLTDRHLLASNGDGYFTIHGLVRDFAAEVAFEETEADRVRALGRLRSWFLHSAARAQATWLAFQEQRLPDLVAGVVPEEFDSPQAASRWFEAHESYLRDLIETCVADGDPTGHLLAPMVFSDLNRRQGTARAGLELFQLAESGAEQLGDLEGQAACANAVAGSAYGRRELDTSLVAITRSRDLYERVGSIAGQLRTEGNRAIVLIELDRIDEAAAAHEAVIEAARRDPNHVLLGRFLFNASDFYLQVGRLDDAARTGEEAVELLAAIDEYGDLHAVATGNLADVHAAAGRLPEAVEVMTRAIVGYRRLGRRGHEAHALCRLGVIFRDLGRTDDALRCLREADDLLVALGVSDTGRVSRAEVSELIESLDDRLSDE